MAKQSRWRVAVNGSSSLLEWLASQEWAFWEVVLIEDAYCLVPIDDSGVTVAEDVWEWSESRIRTLNVAVDLAERGTGDIVRERVIESREDGTKRISLYLHGQVAVSGTLSVSSNGRNERGEQPIPLAEVLASLVDDPVYDEAARFLVARSASWTVNLNKVVELIQDDIREQTRHSKRKLHGIGSMDWPLKNDIARFFKTVNSPELSGRDARHAVQRPQRAMESIAGMTRTEAEQFVKSIFVSWARWRADRQGNENDPQ